jgi:septum formation topological specificity factor MinE
MEELHEELLKIIFKFTAVPEYINIALVWH